MSLENRNEFESDLCIVQEEVRSGVTEKYAKAKEAHWEIWLTYCEKSHVDPFLISVANRVEILQVFARRLRDGRIAPSGRQIRSKSVSDYLTLVGQKFANMGSGDPRLNKYGKIDFWLA